MNSSNVRKPVLTFFSHFGKGDVMRRNSIVPVLLSILLAFFVAAVDSTNGAAATVYWTGATGEFNAAGNWGGTDPAGNDCHFYTNATNLSNTLSGDISINSLTMDGTGSSPVTIGNNQLTVGAITSNAGAGLLTIDSNVGLLGSAQNWTPGSGGLTVNGIISATNTGWNLKQVGTGGTLTLNGANTWGAPGNGGFTIDTAGGKVILGNESALGYGNFTLRDSALWDSSMSGSHTLTHSNNMTFYDTNGSYTFVGSNSLNMGNGYANFTGGSSNGTCTLAVNGNTLTFGGDVTLKNDYTEGNTFGYGFKKTGAGTLVLNGATDSSTRGEITLDEGGLSVGNAEVFGRSNFVWKDNTTLDATSNVTLNMLSGRLFKIYGGGDHIFAGSNDLDTGTIDVAVYSGATNLVVNGSKTLTFGGPVDLGGYALWKKGPGALTMNGATTSTTASQVILDDGRLNIGNAAVFGNSSFVWKSGTTLDATTNLTLAMNATRSFQLYGGGNFTFAGSNSLNTGTVEVAIVAGNANVAVNNGSTLTFGGNVVGDYNLKQTGNGTLVLNGTLSNSALLVETGTLTLGVAGDVNGTLFNQSPERILAYGDGAGGFGGTYKVAFDGTKSVSNHDVRSEMYGGGDTYLGGLAAQMFAAGSPGSGDISMQWRERSTSEAATSMASNVLGLGGTAVPSKYLLAMAYDPSQLGGDETVLASAGLISVFSKSGSNWVNTGWSFQGNGALPTTVGGFDSLAALSVGAYGIDTASDTVWVVLNHASEFAVATIPEPGAMSLLTAGLIGLLAYAWRRRK